jgi:hypothetical protein
MSFFSSSWVSEGLMSSSLPSRYVILTPPPASSRASRRAT